MPPPDLDFRSLRTALRRCSPVVVDVPAGVRYVLLQRYVEASMNDARISLAAFGVLLFGLAYEAPLVPRLLAWAGFAALYLVRTRRGRRLRDGLDRDDPRSDPAFDLMLLGASSVWGIAPILLQGSIGPLNQFCVLYAAFVASALLSISYITAMPATLVLVAASVAPPVVFLLVQGSPMLALVAAGALLCAAALLRRAQAGHATLLQALAAERENAELVDELQTLKRALERENRSLGSSLRQAEQAADRDPLTGLHNRRHVTAVARAAAAPVRARSETVTICLIDVDHFKRVNDVHGHPAGDQVLCAIGERLGERLRDGDCLARIGGEEFMVLLRHCAVGRARHVAEALRRHVAATPVATGVGPVAVTVSLGVAEWSPGEAFEKVVERADRALYEAKHGGRDRVEIEAGDVWRLTTLPMPIDAPATLH